MEYEYRFENYRRKYGNCKPCTLIDKLTIRAPYARMLLLSIRCKVYEYEYQGRWNKHMIVDYY